MNIYKWHDNHKHVHKVSHTDTMLGVIREKTKNNEKEKKRGRQKPETSFQN